MICGRGKHRLFRLCWLLGALAMAASPFVDSSSAQDSAKPIDPKTITSHAVGEHGAVSTGSPEAVAAGLEVLKRGGNAADGAAATILALSVTDSHLFCFGGEAPIMAYNAQRKHIEVLAAQGVAPRLATREAFPEGIPGQGLKPAAVPAVFDGVLVLLERHGTMRLADVAAGTLRLLDRHQEPWHPLLSKTLRRILEAEAAAGDDRILGLRRAADYFYRGPIAREISAWCEKEGGYLRYEDFATHVTRIEEPLSVDYRGHRVYKCGAWTQGPYLLQTLKLLEGFDLAKLGHNRPETIHLSVEAMKLAMADRDIYFGDPLFVDVPINDILSSNYVATRRSLIDREKASLVYRPGDPVHQKPLLDKPLPTGNKAKPSDTTTCVVADRFGNVVVATPSGWSGVQAGDTGIWLGTRLQSFNTWEGQPNCIVPGKRPRITLTPTLVFKDDRPVLAVSVAGGDGQDQTGLQVVLNHIDFGLYGKESLAGVRFGTNHHIGSFRQTPPELGSLMINAEADSATVDALTKMGHKVKLETGAMWMPSLIRISDGKFEAAGDPRAGRHAGAF